MRRVTISLDDSLAEQFDRLMVEKGYENRSEAVRDLLRRMLEESRVQTGTAKHCVATLSYVYNHHERELSHRLTSSQHAHHDLILSTLHVHLDHDNCIETMVLRGPIARVQQFADSIIAERSVRHGKLNLVPVDVESPRFRHVKHTHLHPKT